MDLTGHNSTTRVEEHDAHHVSTERPPGSATLTAAPNRIPVYVVNALYLWPITLWTYLKYGRPENPVKSEELTSGHNKSEAVENDRAGGEHQHRHHDDGERSMFATVTIGVCHCGAGCVLGDIVGEWLVYGTGAEINGESLWVTFLVGQWFHDASLMPLASMQALIAGQTSDSQ